MVWYSLRLAGTKKKNTIQFHVFNDYMKEKGKLEERTRCKGKKHLRKGQVYTIGTLKPLSLPDSIPKH